jgi:hypothetical protein
MPKVARHGPVTNTQQTYPPLTNTSKPALRDQAGLLAAVVPGINIKETISTVKFGINYRFGAY